MSEIENICRSLHETYEAEAPKHGWKTQEASAVPWEKVPENQKELMREVVRIVFMPLLTAEREAREVAERQRDESRDYAITEANKLRARVQELEADARRYRLLYEQVDSDGFIPIAQVVWKLNNDPNAEWANFPDGEAMSNTIDAFIADQLKEEKK